MLKRSSWGWANHENLLREIYRVISFQNFPGYDILKFVIIRIVHNLHLWKMLSEKY